MPPQCRKRSWSTYRVSLALGLHYFLAGSELAGGQQANWHKLQCLDTPGCVKGVEGKSLAFSALHDVLLKEVAIFVDYAMIDDNGGEEPVECLYWSGNHSETQPVKLNGTAVRIWDNKPKFAPYVIKCPDPVLALKCMPDWIGFIHKGEDTQIRMPVERVGLKQLGTIGACNGVVYSKRFEMLYEWLQHYTRLGVDGFNVYYTQKQVEWAAAERTPSQPVVSNYPNVAWFEFDHLSLGDRWLYSQQTVYNECVYRLRHTYKYLLMFDMDEFLVIRDSRFSGSDGLKRLLDHVFPRKRAAVGIFRYAYRSDCHPEGSAKSEVYHERFTHRLKQHEGHRTWPMDGTHADKLIIKPEGIDRAYVHFTDSVRPGWERETVNTQPSMVMLKHVGKDIDCTDLVEELPGDLP